MQKRNTTIVNARIITRKNSVRSGVKLGSDPNYTLYERAYSEFQDVYEAETDTRWQPLSYNAVEAVERKEWQFFQGLHLSGDLGE